MGFRTYDNPEARAPPEVEFVFDTDGTLEAYAIAGGEHTPENIYRTRQTSPSGDGWSDWTPVGPSGPGVDFRSIDVLCDRDGWMHVFAVGSGHGAYHVRQLPPDGRWSGLHRLGRDDSYFLDLWPIEHGDGRLEVFGVGTARGIASLRQQWRNGAWEETWNYVGPARDRRTGIIQDVVQYPNGRVEVFIVSASEGRLYRSSRPSPDAGWSNWAGF